MKRFIIFGAMMLVSNVSLVCAMHNYDGKEAIILRLQIRQMIIKSGK